MLRSVRAAVSFLTIFPVGPSLLDAHDVSHGTVFFPLVGAAIGGLVASAGLVLFEWARAPSLVAAGVAVSIGSIATGAIHLDGLADSADALGARTRERALDVMREHSVGAFGALALVLDLLLKVTAIGALLDEHRSLGVLVASAALARAAPLPVGARAPYARDGSGSGRIVTEHLSLPRALLALLVAVAIAIASIRLRAVVAIATIGLVTWLWTLISRRRFGGVTGDTLGANVEICETLALIAATAMR